MARRRRQAWQNSPVPAALTAEFSEGEHAVITVMADMIKRSGGGPCALCRADVMKQRGSA
jgi:hypothetical protein